MADVAQLAVLLFGGFNDATQTVGDEVARGVADALVHMILVSVLIAAAIFAVLSMTMVRLLRRADSVAGASVAVFMLLVIHLLPIGLSWTEAPASPETSPGRWVERIWIPLLWSVPLLWVLRVCWRRRDSGQTRAWTALVGVVALLYLAATAGFAAVSIRQRGDVLTSVTLEEEVRSALDLEPGHRLDLATLTQVKSLQARGVSSLQGLEHMVNLEQLLVARSPLRNLDGICRAPLVELELQELDTDLSALGECEGLRVLRLKNVVVRDWTAIGTLPNLRVLEVTSWNDKNWETGDLQPLAQLPNLVELRLDRLAFETPPWPTIGAISSLEVLSIGDAPAPDLHPLAELPALRSLELTRIDPPPSLEGLPKTLQELTIHATPLSKRTCCETIPRLIETGLTVEDNGHCTEHLPCPTQP